MNRMQSSDDSRSVHQKRSVCLRAKPRASRGDDPPELIRNLLSTKLTEDCAALRRSIDGVFPTVMSPQLPGCENGARCKLVKGHLQWNLTPVLSIFADVFLIIMIRIQRYTI
jgi:hypothetical protein